MQYLNSTYRFRWSRSLYDTHSGQVHTFKKMKSNGQHFLFNKFKEGDNNFTKYVKHTIVKNIMF